MSFSLRALFRYTARQREAARQMWDVVRSGILFEIPASLSTDDDTLKAVMLMCEEHPEAAAAERNTGGLLVFQSRGIVVGLRAAMSIGPVANQVLDTFGYRPDPLRGLESVIQNQETFIRTRGGMEPEEAVKRSQQEAAERNRVVVNVADPADAVLPVLEGSKSSG